MTYGCIFVWVSIRWAGWSRKRETWNTRGPQQNRANAPYTPPSIPPSISDSIRFQRGSGEGRMLWQYYCTASADGTVVQHRQSSWPLLTANRSARIHNHTHTLIHARTPDTHMANTNFSIKKVPLHCVTMAKMQHIMSFNKEDMIHRPTFISKLNPLTVFNLNVELGLNTTYGPRWTFLLPHLDA